MVITRAQADERFAADIAPLLPLVAGRPVVEAAALVSFGYNCGEGALKRLLAGQIDFKYGRTSGGVELPGLVARRALEEMLVEVGKGGGV
jgi:GH24 family phage-related lysozyme (muramidase)